MTATSGVSAVNGHRDPVHNITENERQIFQHLLRPDDSYDEHGVYWADMPLAKRVKFVGDYDNKEARRELRSIWNMMKVDPLSPVSYYFRNMVIPGAGLGLEGLGAVTDCSCCLVLMCV